MDIKLIAVGFIVFFIISVLNIIFLIVEDKSLKKWLEKGIITEKGFKILDKNSLKRFWIIFIITTLLELGAILYLINGYYFYPF